MARKMLFSRNDLRKSWTEYILMEKDPDSQAPHPELIHVPGASLQ